MGEHYRILKMFKSVKTSRRKKGIEGDGFKLHLFIGECLGSELPDPQQRWPFRQAWGIGSLVGKRGTRLRSSLGETKSSLLHYFEGGRTGISLLKERMSAEFSSLVNLGVILGIQKDARQSFDVICF